MVAVSALTAKNLPAPDRQGRVDMRTGGRPLAGTYVYEGDQLVTTPHSHDLHQIEYALHGYVEVETSTARYLLPPQQAVWLPAGAEHISTIHTAVRTVSVFLHPSLLRQAQADVRILGVSPLVREMILYAQRWPIQREQEDSRERDFFRCFANLISETLDQDTPLRLPAASHPALATALAHTREHLNIVTAQQAASAAGLSERTLRRLCASDINMSWRSYLTHARLLQAMALLTEATMTVLSAATAVGFDSPSAFTRAFTGTFGETPSAYQRRITARST